MNSTFHESSENYLETILILSTQGVKVRSVDVAQKLDFTRPSVSIAMKKLRENALILVDTDGYITLTEKGKLIADSVYERHILLSDWLVSLGVDPKTAVFDACRIEHVISEQSFLAIKQHLQHLQQQ
ncbi:MAG: metal-dependent transcriptional regulator [Firmicutes bacterium]|nr:metal-dependent transcriptional regulator [Bacillota bacterium]